MAEFYDPEPVPGGKSYDLNIPKPCVVCRGTGKVQERLTGAQTLAGLIPSMETCSACSGRGMVSGTVTIR